MIMYERVYCEEQLDNLSSDIPFIWINSPDEQRDATEENYPWFYLDEITDNFMFIYRLNSDQHFLMLGCPYVVGDEDV